MSHNCRSKFQSDTCSGPVYLHSIVKDSANHLERRILTHPDGAYFLAKQPPRLIRLMFNPRSVPGIAPRTFLSPK